MNGNDPAMPIPGGYATFEQYQPGVGSYLTTVQVSTTGITKRELFAAIAMQGLLSRTPYADPEAFALHAVKHANALIAELNKTEETK